MTTTGAVGLTRPRAVLMDLGGVLLDWDPRHLYRKVFGPDEAGMEHFLAHICTPAWHREQDRGWSVVEACAERRALFPEHAALIEAWAERSDEMIGAVIEGAVEVLAELKAAGVPCYALSNMERETWERRRHIYGFLRWFDGYFISGCEGVMKPEPEYFTRALARLGLRPTEAFFVDDRAENVAAAAQLGVQAVIFRGAGDLRLELARRRLLDGCLTGPGAPRRACAKGALHPGEDLAQDAGTSGEIQTSEPLAPRAEIGPGAEAHSSTRQ